MSFSLHAVVLARGRRFSSLPSPEEASKVAAPSSKPGAVPTPTPAPSTAKVVDLPPTSSPMETPNNRAQYQQQNPRPNRGPPVDPRTRRFFIAVGVAACALQISTSIGVIMAINNPSEE